MADTPIIFAAGAAHVDRRGRATGRYRARASNPGRIAETIGGSMLNACVALRALDADVTLCSGRGGDAEGQQVALALAAAGIGDLAVVWLDRRTPGYMAILDDRGELMAAIADMALYDHMQARLFSRRHIREAMAGCQALLLDANLPASAIAHLLDVFNERPSAAIGVSPAKAIRLAPYLGRLSSLFLSRAEAASIVEATANTSVAVLARLLDENGARRAVITDGPLDVAVLENGVIMLQTPPAVASLRDVTGAGDTLAAVASFHFFAGRPFLEAVRLGIAAASRQISAEIAEPQTAPANLDTLAAGMVPPRPVDDR